MPLTDKGEKIMHNMKQEYGPEGGERVFYASENAGKIRRVEKRGYKRRNRRKHARKRTRK